MRFENVELLKIGKEDPKLRDTKDRMFYDVQYKDNLPVLENDAPIHVQDFGVANNFKIENSILKCDILVYDKYDTKVEELLKQNCQAHTFLSTGEKNMKKEDGLRHIKKAIITGIFFNPMKLYPDFKDLKDYRTDKPVEVKEDKEI